MTKKKLSHYIVAWGPPSGSQILNYKGVKTALRDAKRFDKECPRDKHKVYAVYVQEVPR
jgi:hypothetical protein